VDYNVVDYISALLPKKIKQWGLADDCQDADVFLIYSVEVERPGVLVTQQNVTRQAQQASSVGVNQTAERKAAQGGQVAAIGRDGSAAVNEERGATVTTGSSLTVNPETNAAFLLVCDKEGHEYLRFSTYRVGSAKAIAARLVDQLRARFPRK